MKHCEWQKMSPFLITTRNTDQNDTNSFFELAPLSAANKKYIIYILVIVPADWTARVVYVVGLGDREGR